MGGSEEIVKRTLGGLGNVGPVYSGRLDWFPDQDSGVLSEELCNEISSGCFSHEI